MGERPRDDSLNNDVQHEQTHSSANDLHSEDERPVDNSGNLLDPNVENAPNTVASYEATSYRAFDDESSNEAAYSDDSSADSTDSDSASVEELRDQIEQTRADMTATVDELADRLNPEALKAQVQDATIGRVHEVAAVAKEKAHDLAIVAKDKAQELAGVASVKAHELAGVANEKLQEAKARAEEKAGQMSHHTDNSAAALIDGSSTTSSNGMSASISEFDDGGDARSPLDRVKSWVRRNPVPVAVGVAGLVAVLALRRRTDDEETYIVEIVD